MNLDEQQFLAKLLLNSTDVSTDMEAFIHLMFDEAPHKDFTQPVWHDAIEHLHRKYRQATEFNYSIRVAEAASIKGCTPDAIRKAIAREDLLAKKVKNRWLIDTQSLESWNPGNQGPKAQGASHPISMRFGHEPGRKMVVLIDGQRPEATKVEEGLHELEVERWQQIVVYATSDKGRRCSILEPAPTKNKLKHGSMYVEGMFEATHENNKRRADVLWKQLKPSATENV